MFSESEISKSSTWRELLATYNVLRAYKSFDRWGPHSIHRFLVPSELGRFHDFAAVWLNSCMEYLDVFTASWNNKNNWLFPPPYMIPRVLKHLKLSSADATLVAPLWLSAPWWPLI